MQEEEKPVLVLAAALEVLEVSYLGAVSWVVHDSGLWFLGEVGDSLPCREPTREPGMWNTHTRTHTHDPHTHYEHTHTRQSTGATVRR